MTAPLAAGELSRIQNQEYGQSLRVIEGLGQTALGHIVAGPEQTATLELAYADFTSAVAEMLKTLPEFRDALDIDRRHEQPIINNQVCDDEGTPMVDILRAGWDKSLQLAATEPAMADQAERDACDVVIAEQVDALPVGQTLWGISMDPKQSLAAHPELFKNRLGYKAGLLYVQAYSKVSDSQLVTFSYSVDMSDEGLWRETAAAFGMNVPAGTSTNQWLRHAVEIEADPAQTQNLLLAMRQDYYRRRGTTGKRHSVSDFVDSHDKSLRGLFATYYPSLGEASRTGLNNRTLQDFANTLLQTDLSKMKPGVRQQLVRIANSPRFDRVMGTTVNSLVRYAAAEELQRYLPGFLAAEAQNRTAIVPKVWLPPVIKQAIGSLQHVHDMLSRGIGRGMKAGRSYGGCPGNIELTTSTEQSDVSRQEAYGGKAEQQPPEHCEEIKDGQEVQCPECKQKVRAIVPDRETIYCSNAECKLAAPGLKEKVTSVPGFFGKLLAAAVHADGSEKSQPQPV